jgi:hypothetical protein
MIIVTSHHVCLVSTEWHLDTSASCRFGCECDSTAGNRRHTNVPADMKLPKMIVEYSWSHPPTRNGLCSVDFLGPCPSKRSFVGQRFRHLRSVPHDATIPWHHQFANQSQSHVPIPMRKSDPQSDPNPSAANHYLAYGPTRSQFARHCVLPHAVSFHDTPIPPTH